MEVGYEVKSTQELWRRPYCIFTVSYPTTTMVCVQGLRGKFKLHDAKALNNIFFLKGFTTLIFERDVEGKLVSRTYELTKVYANVKATTFQRSQ